MIRTRRPSSYEAQFQDRTLICRDDSYTPKFWDKDKAVRGNCLVAYETTLHTDTLHPDGACIGWSSYEYWKKITIKRCREKGCHVTHFLRGLDDCNKYCWECHPNEFYPEYFFQLRNGSYCIQRYRSNPDSKQDQDTHVMCWPLVLDDDGVNIEEYGNQDKAQLMRYEAGHVFEIRREGTIMSFWHNGIRIHEEHKASQDPLFAHRRLPKLCEVRNIALAMTEQDLAEKINATDQDGKSPLACILASKQSPTQSALETQIPFADLFVLLLHNGAKLPDLIDPTYQTENISNFLFDTMAMAEHGGVYRWRFLRDAVRFKDEKLVRMLLLPAGRSSPNVVLPYTICPSANQKKVSRIKNRRGGLSKGGKGVASPLTKLESPSGSEWMVPEEINQDDDDEEGEDESVWFPEDDRAKSILEIACTYRPQDCTEDGDNRDLNILNLLLDYRPSDTALKANDPELCKHVDVNRKSPIDGRTVLHLVAKAPEKTRKLTSDFAERLLSTKLAPEWKDDYGRTALHYAAESNQIGVVDLLIKHHVDVDAVTQPDRVDDEKEDQSEDFNYHGVSAPSSSSSSSRGCCGKKRKLHPTSRPSGTGYRSSDVRTTALHLATQYGHWRIVTSLLQSKAAANLPDHEGQTPLTIALWRRKTIKQELNRITTRLEKPRTFGTKLAVQLQREKERLEMELQNAESSKDALFKHGAEFDSALMYCKYRPQDLIQADEDFNTLHKDYHRFWVKCEEEKRKIDHQYLNTADLEKQKAKFKALKSQRAEIFKEKYNQAVIQYVYQRTVEGGQQCRLLLYLIFLILITWFGVQESTRSEKLAHFINDGISDMATSQYDYNISAIPKTFSGIDGIDEFWDWARGTFIESFYSPTMYYVNDTLVQRNGLLFNQNYIIGVPRFRQIRSPVRECHVPDIWKSWADVCFPEVMDGYIPYDDAPWGPNLEYRFHTQDELQGIQYWGTVGWYHGGGYIVDFPSPHNDSSADEAAAMVEHLIDINWIDARTRAVFVEFSVYNANGNFFVVGVMLLELPVSGGMMVSWDMNIARLSRWMTDADIQLYQVEWFITATIFYFFLKEIVQMAQMGGDYFKSFYNLIDWVCFSLYAAVLYLYFKCLAIEETINFFEKDSYVPLLQISTRFRWKLYLLSGVILCYWLKLLEYLAVYRTFARLVVMIEFIVRRISGSFLILLFIVWVAFTSVEYMVYGYRTDGEYTWQLGMVTRMTDTVVGADLGTEQAANLTAASIYTTLFVLIVGLLLINLLIAILTTAYEDAREDSGAAFWAKNQYRAIVRESGYPGCFNRGGCCDVGLISGSGDKNLYQFKNKRAYYAQTLYILVFRPGDYFLPWIGLIASNVTELAENCWLWIRRPFMANPRTKKPERIDVHDGNIFRSQTRDFTRTFSKIQRRREFTRRRWCGCCLRKDSTNDILLGSTSITSSDKKTGYYLSDSND